jgi:hypothetical protein
LRPLTDHAVLTPFLSPDVLSKAPYVFPIIGGRKVEHLHENIKALTLKLTSEQIAAIEGVKEFDVSRLSPTSAYLTIWFSPNTNGIPSFSLSRSVSRTTLSALIQPSTEARL